MVSRAIGRFSVSLSVLPSCSVDQLTNVYTKREEEDLQEMGRGRDEMYICMSDKVRSLDLDLAVGALSFTSWAFEVETRVGPSPTGDGDRSP